MDAPVIEHAAAIGRVRPPAEDDAALAQDARFNRDRSAERAVRDDLTQHQVVGVPAPVLVDRENLSAFPGGGQDRVELVRVERDRLFADHVLAGPQCFNRVVAMELVGRGDDDQVQVRLGQEQGAVGKKRITGLTSFSFFCRVDIVYGKDIDAGDRGDFLRMDMAHVSVAKNACANHSDLLTVLFSRDGLPCLNSYVYHACFGNARSYIANYMDKMLILRASAGVC